MKIDCGWSCGVERELVAADPDSTCPACQTPLWFSVQRVISIESKTSTDKWTRILGSEFERLAGLMNRADSGRKPPVIAIFRYSWNGRDEHDRVWWRADGTLTRLHGPGTPVEFKSPLVSRTAERRQRDAELNEERAADARRALRRATGMDD